MPITICEQALDRVLAYLEWSGIPLTDSVCLAALKLVESVLAEPAEDPLAAVMDRLPEHFQLPHGARPPLAPPLKRGSIGYYDY